MSYMAVSTFNSAGFQKYGKRMMDSFHQHWPEQIGLRVYREGWDIPQPHAATPDLLASSDWLKAFKERHKQKPTNDFRMDAVRFSHKVAALLAADTSTSARYIIWLDGDIVTHAPVSMEDIAKLTPVNGQWIAWLDRRRAYPECGFYIIDRQHPRHAEAMAVLRRMYAEDWLFVEKEWHDSYILQQIVTRDLQLPCKSLSGDLGWRTSHPFVNGPLGAFMDHMKGKRKEKGRSHRTDLIRERLEPYWQRQVR
jgi:hypothetical protein